MSNDFDFLLGRWNVVNHRLTQWLDGSNEWIEFESTHEERKLSFGQGTVAYHQYVMDRIPYERNIIRSYNERWDSWKIDRLDGKTSLVMTPLQGTFWDNKGCFLSKGAFGTLPVLVWVEWTKICESYASWEQSLSKDNGRTWETSWVMEFFRQ